MQDINNFSGMEEEDAGSALPPDNAGMEEMQRAIAAVQELKGEGKVRYSQEAEPLEEEGEIPSPVEEEEEEGEPQEDGDVSGGEAPEEEYEEEKPDSLRIEKRKRYNIIREKRIIESNLAAAEMRAQQLEELLQQSLKAGTFHYKQSVYNELEKAQQNKAAALDSGDARRVVDADYILDNIKHKIRELDSWDSTASRSQVAQQEYQPQNNNVPHQARQDAEFVQEVAADWIQDHPYLQPNSSQFNRNLYNNVSTFITRLNANLEREGQLGLVGGEEYFDAIDRYVNEIKNTAPVTRPKAPVAQVGGVRNSYSAAPSRGRSSSEVKLTALDKHLLANMKDSGVTAASYLKAKIARENNNNNR